MTPEQRAALERIQTDRDYARTDLGNAELFADLHRHRIRHVRERGTWLVCEHGRWRRDRTGEAERAAKDVARERLRRSLNLDGDDREREAKWALASQSDSRLRGLLNVAGTEEGIVVAAEQLDADPMLLACANGTLDLRSGELRPHDPDDLLTLGNAIDYEPTAACPRWLRFLEEVFDSDTDLLAFVQRAIGYSLTGDTREHVLFVLHGAGCNGKTTFVETVKRLAGDLAVSASFDTFMRTRGDRGPRNDLARLHRARLVTASESGEGRRLDEATVKGLTGGDTVTARFLYGEHFEYRPEFKLWLVTNHRPRVDGDDDAIWRRLRLVPFEQNFEGREDRELDIKLAAELPGILTWAVEGCLAWQRDGLGTAGAVTRATREYRQDEDVLGAFLTDRCTLNGATPVADLREAYEAYCRDLGEKPLSGSALGRRLGKRGIRSAASNGSRAYQGVSLR